MAGAIFQMPKPRDFGWALKPAAASHFAIHTRPNGQKCIVLTQPLLRGVRAEMIDWWFRTFPTLTVRLNDVPGYEDVVVPAYYLWHPTDHHSASVTGSPDGRPAPGAKIRIREAFQVPTYGTRYSVDQALTIQAMGPGLWAMGKVLPLIGPAMSMRIRYADAAQAGAEIGTHYHYEVVIGVSLPGPIGRALNARITKTFSEELFTAWHQHNVHEVGTFEAFLPALWSQRDAAELTYAPSMAPTLPDPAQQSGFSRALFEDRLRGYKSTRDPFAYQAAPELALA